MLNLIELNNDDKDLPRKAKRRNSINTGLDFTSLITLILGIFLVILFCSINVSNKKETKTNTQKSIEVKISEPLPTIKCEHFEKTPMDEKINPSRKQ